MVRKHIKKFATITNKQKQSRYKYFLKEDSHGEIPSILLKGIAKKTWVHGETYTLFLGKSL